MTRAMRARAAAPHGPRAARGASRPGATGAPARSQVEQALEVLLGTPVSLLCANDACRLSLHFRTMDDLESLLRTLIAARAREGLGLAPPAAQPVPLPTGPRDLRLVGTRARRGKARNVAAYGPRPDPVRQ